MIDTLDKDLLKDRNARNARNLYEFLCEFAHPNCIGTVGLFGKIEKNECIHHFSEENMMVGGIASQVVAGLGSASVVVWSHQQVSELLPEITNLSKADHTP